MKIISSGAFLSLLALTTIGCDDYESGISTSENDLDIDTDVNSDSDTDRDSVEKNCLDEIAWYQENSGGIAHVIKEKEPNAFGLYDMFGNVPEWVEDCYHEDLNNAPIDGSPWVDDCIEDGEGFGTLYVLRGGGYGSSPKVLRTSARAGAPSSFYGSLTPGFRCVRAAGSESSADETEGLVWIDLPAGSFDMGCSPDDEDCDENELPTRSVSVGAFQINEAEITQQQYFDHFGSAPNPANFCPECGQDYVSWDHAKLFCEALGARLPTETEWEYAARAGGTTRFSCLAD